MVNWTLAHFQIAYWSTPGFEAYKLPALEMEQIIKEGTILMEVALLEEDLAQLAERQKLLKEKIYEIFVDFLQKDNIESSTEHPLPTNCSGHVEA
nr:unnamed protein product [Spirometra erinaceieuropaei]